MYKSNIIIFVHTGGGAKLTMAVCEIGDLMVVFEFLLKSGYGVMVFLVYNPVLAALKLSP